MRKRNRKTRKSTTWQTKDGRELPIVEMGDLYLYNTLKLLERWITNEDPNRESLYLREKHLSRYGVLVLEAIKRGLYEWSTERKYLRANVEKTLGMGLIPPKRIMLQPKSSFANLRSRMDELSAPRRVV